MKETRQLLFISMETVPIPASTSTGLLVLPCLHQSTSMNAQFSSFLFFTKCQICCTLHRHNIFIQTAVGNIYSVQSSDAYMRQQLLGGIDRRIILALLIPFITHEGQRGFSTISWQGRWSLAAVNWWDISRSSLLLTFTSSCTIQWSITVHHLASHWAIYMQWVFRMYISYILFYLTQCLST